MATINGTEIEQTYKIGIESHQNIKAYEDRYIASFGVTKLGKAWKRDYKGITQNYKSIQNDYNLGGCIQGHYESR